MLKQRAQATNPKLKNHKELPLRTCKLPLDECMQTTSQNRAAVSALLWLVRPVHLTGQTGGQDRQQLGTTSVKPVDDSSQADDHLELHELKNSSKPLKNLVNACIKPKHAQTSPPCWQCMDQAENAKNAT
jgi:hypothetical protein